MIRSRGAALAALALLAIAAPATALVGAPSAAWADDGPTVFNDNCAVCHSTEPGVDKLGPSLAGVVGRPYSEAMQHAGVTWTKLVLDKYLTNPQAVVKGTKMPFAGLKNAKDRKALIDYLATFKN